MSDTLDDAWSLVSQYLADNPQSLPQSQQQQQLSYSLSLPPVQPTPLIQTTGRTPLTIRRKRRQATSAIQSSTSTSTPTAASSSATTAPEWAATDLRAFSSNVSPHFASLSKVCHLPSATLLPLCHQYLRLDTCSAPALASFIQAAVTDTTVSYENQQILLRCAAQSRWFSEAIPAVLQTQLIALLPDHSPVIVAALMLPLLESPEKLHASLASMLIKCIKSKGMPLASTESVAMGITTLVLEKAIVLNDSTYLVMEALLSVIPVDRPSSASGWLKRWPSVMQKMAPMNPDSRKLCSLMLLLVNKFGTHLAVSHLDQISSAAGLLTVPQKKAVVLAAARKVEKKNQ